MPEDINKTLVDELDRLEKLQKEIDDKLHAVKSELIALSQRENKETLFGTHKLCSIRSFDKVVYPEDKTIIVKMIKDKGLYDHFSHLNYPRLSAAIIKNDVDKEIINEVRILKDFRIKLIDRGV